MKQHELQPPDGATTPRRRIGRGHGSGRGKTAGKGTKGQQSRSGGTKGPRFEGGQLPLVRRLPYKRGFKNPFRVEYRPVNLGDLDAPLVVRAHRFSASARAKIEAAGGRAEQLGAD